MPLEEFKELSQAHGLVPANQTYGQGLDEGSIKAAGDFVFTADCRLGDFKPAERTGCGSLIASAIHYQPKYADEEATVDLIKEAWSSKNPLKTIR